VAQYFFLGGRLLQIGYEISPFILLLQACEHHLCSRNILSRVLKIHPECVLPPGDTLVLVSLGVSEALGLTSFTPEEPVKVRPGHMFAARVVVVALLTALLEDLLSLIKITIWNFGGRRISSLLLWWHLVVC